MHTDPDEVVFPTGGSFSLAGALSRQPPHVAAARFLNFEGQPEAVDLTNRFEQVTLFRTHQVGSALTAVAGAATAARL